MPSKVRVINQSKPTRSALTADVCSSFGSKLRGLMFQSRMDAQDAILIDGLHESRLGTSIHMFFMNFDIAAIWIDSHYRVVDTCLARRWRPYYASRLAARYVLEANPRWLEHFQPGDYLEFIRVP